MDRRAFLAGAAALLTAPLAVGAQPAGKVWRVGSLSTGVSTGSSIRRLLSEGLQALGYVEGSFILELRYAEGRVDRLPALAAELVQLDSDVIVAWGPEPLAAVRNAPRRTPIVMVARGDPVAIGLVASLAKPGGNITGMTIGGPELAGKRLELLREALPRLSRVAVLRDPTSEPALMQETESAARALSLRTLVFTVRAPTDFDGVFQAAVRQRAEAVLINETSMLTANQVKLAELAARSRLPAVGVFRSSAQTGFLMSYGPDVSDLVRRVATYVDKILKGAKPGDLPIEQPTKFELVINLKTAKALGLTIPRSLLLQADQVIE
jgi:putative tryptophan/tyrosine transport system substrate-binding protein